MAVGYIGLGDIGAPMAERLLRGGQPVMVWNRTPAKMEPIVAAGALAGTSPAALGSACDIVFLCLDSVSAIETVLFGEEGVVTGAEGRNILVVDNSTTSPMVARSIAARLGEHGMRFIDAPVSGGPVGARAGTLAALLGGDEADVAEAQPFIATFAQRISHLGPVGAGQAAKACNQIMNFSTLQGIAEALAVGTSFGLPRDQLARSVLGGFAESALLREYLRGTEAGENGGVTLLANLLIGEAQGHSNPAVHGKLGILTKDIDIAVGLVRDTGISAPVTEHLGKLFHAMNG